MQKVRLHDCCGARHIFGFGNDPNQGRIPLMVYPHPRVNSWQTFTIHMSPADWLETVMMEHRDGGCLIVHQGAQYKFYPDNPGITTAIITRQQNVLWGPVLERLGFKVTVNNIKNLNSGNQLFLYTRIENHLYGQYEWTLDGRPYRGRIRFRADGVTPMRVRNSEGQLAFPQRTSEVQQSPMVI